MVTDDSRRTTYNGGMAKIRIILNSSAAKISPRYLKDVKKYEIWHFR